jgi:hypothetical protein
VAVELAPALPPLAINIVSFVILLPGITATLLAIPEAFAAPPYPIEKYIVEGSNEALINTLD